MKFHKYLLFLALLLAVVACKPRETLVPEPEPIEEEPVAFNGYDADLISIEEDIVWGLSVHMTRLDTSYAGTSQTLGWYALLANDDSLIVSMDIPASVNYEREFRKQWIEYYQKWRVYYGIIINTLDSPEEAKITAKFQSELTGKEYIRERTYYIKRGEAFNDVFSVKFGTPVNEVRGEISRLSVLWSPNSGWNEVLKDSLYYINYVSGRCFLSPLMVPHSVAIPAVYYEFEKGKLAAVSEIVHPEAQDIKDQKEFESLKKTFEYLGAKTLPFESEPPYRYTDQPLTWTKNGLEMTFDKRSFKLNEEDVEAYALTIRLAEGFVVK